MSTKRTPIQIILIEQLLYSVIFSVLLAAFIFWIPQFFVGASWLSPDLFGIIYFGVVLISLVAWHYVWLPITCVRIWRSAKEKLVGLWLGLSKLYVLGVAALVIYFSIISFPQLFAMY